MIQQKMLHMVSSVLTVGLILLFSRAAWAKDSFEWASVTMLLLLVKTVILEAIVYGLGRAFIRTKKIGWYVAMMIISFYLVMVCAIVAFARLRYGEGLDWVVLLALLFVVITGVWTWFVPRIRHPKKRRSSR